MSAASTSANGCRLVTRVSRSTRPEAASAIAAPSEGVVPRRSHHPLNRASSGHSLDAALLDVPMPQANPHTDAICERQCADMLQRRRQWLGLAGQVRDLLLRRRAVAEQEDVAAELHLSVCTRRRRLAEEGTSYRELAAETAGLLAEEPLAAGLTVEDVAHRLGYSTASTFTYAFKQWKGTTPGAYARARPSRP
ncbi:MAG: helix-turn-helix domain-containing protein [Micromonosporaceae bacterium]